jgi:hypothetical protein
MYDILVFGICLEIVSYLVWAINGIGGLIQYPFGNAADMLNLQNAFSIDIWMALISGTGVIIGIAALLLRQGTYALYALLIFAIGVFYRIVVPILIVIPNTIAALLPESTNPNFTIVGGLPVYGINPFQVVLGIIVGFAIFVFMFELVTQRKIS